MVWVSGMHVCEGGKELATGEGRGSGQTARKPWNTGKLRDTLAHMSVCRRQVKRVCVWGQLGACPGFSRNRDFYPLHRVWYVAICADFGRKTMLITHQ